MTCLLPLGTMSRALRVRYTLDDSMEARYPGFPPFAEGKYPSLRCHGRAAASRHTQLLSGFPCLLGETAARDLGREMKDPGTTFPINQQDLQSAGVGAWHELCHETVGKIPRQC